MTALPDLDSDSDQSMSMETGNIPPRMILKAKGAVANCPCGWSGFTVNFTSILSMVVP